MAGKRYLIGIDYGTESARGVILDADNGVLMARQGHVYAHGVMERVLPSGRTLPPQWALQDADDYLHAAADILGALARQVPHGGEVVGIGIDCTASSPLPALADGTPLSRLYPHEPHAYVKLWKHHSAQPWAERMNATRADFLCYTGGTTSCEWLASKAAQLAHESPQLWDETERFIEAGDWIVSQLVGCEVRSNCQAGYKAHYLADEGYPEALNDLAPGLIERLGEPRRVGTVAGSLSAQWRARSGLRDEPVVAVATVDAHAVVPAVGVTQPGVMVGSLGTSACHLLLDPQCHAIPGVAGVVRDGIVPGLWGYECGQAGFGDILDWFVRSFPAAADEASSFARYNGAAASIPAGRSGLLALDWWNGCRTPLMNPDLSGLFVGLTLNTRRDEMYRALLESLCFGSRRIIETLEGGGLAIGRLVLTSGLAERNPLLMQIMADVTGREIHVPVVTEATARGAAIHAAVAAGVVTDFGEAAARLGAGEGRRYVPADRAAAVYQRLYGVYGELFDFFAEHRAMRVLGELRYPRG